MKSERKKKTRWIWKVLIVLFFLTAANEIMNRNIIISDYEIVSSKLPPEFNGYKILQITDLHSVRKKEQMDKLLQKVQNIEADIIAITGDLLDAAYYMEEQTAEKNEAGKMVGIAGKDTLDFVEELLKIAPVYYVYGNHEMVLLDDPLKNSFRVALENMGVILMNNKAVEIEKDGRSITLLGIQDPATLYKDVNYANLEGGSQERIYAMLDDVTEQINEEAYTVLLSHRPEYFKVYGEYPIDLVLSGHAHGGQVRIPFLGGLYAPGQGWFPKYTVGVYKLENLSMVVGRGIGNSVVPLRVFDPPEIVVVELCTQSQ